MIKCSVDDKQEKRIMSIIKPPIADYDEAISLIKELIYKEQNFCLTALGAHLVSTWQNYQKNDFLEILESMYADLSDEQKSIMYYLMAYDKYMRNGIVEKLYCIELLKKSIQYDSSYVNNYCLLSMMTDNELERVKLRSNAMDNIRSVVDADDCIGMTRDAMLTLQDYFDELIYGVSITRLEYENIRCMI